MPVTYRIERARGIIRTKCVGAVTIQEVLGHFRTLEQDPECPDRIDVLLDLTEESSVPTRDNIQSIAGEIGRIRRRVQFGACAVVATDEAIFGMLRMFEVFTQQYFQSTRIFRNSMDAEAWLASRHPKTSTAG